MNLNYKNVCAAILIVVAIGMAAYAAYSIPTEAPNLGGTQYYGLCSRGSALFGIRNLSAYIGYNNSENQFEENGSLNSISCYYSIGIMYPVFNGTSEANIASNLTVPESYAHYAYPTGININVIEFRNSSYVSGFAKKFYAKSEKSIRYDSNGTASENGTINITFESRYDSIYGINASEIRFVPIYRNYEEYQLAFKKGNYFVIINTYGINGSYDTEYAKDIMLNDYLRICGTSYNKSLFCL